MSKRVTKREAEVLLAKMAKLMGRTAGDKPGDLALEHNTVIRGSCKVVEVRESGPPDDQIFGGRVFGLSRLHELMEFAVLALRGMSAALDSLTQEEHRLVRLYERASGRSVKRVQRVSLQEFDVTLEGENFSGWMPVECIRVLCKWRDPEVASMTSDPEAAKGGDWEAVDNCDPDVLWGIFDRFVRSQIEGRAA